MKLKDLLRRGLHECFALKRVLLFEMDRAWAMSQDFRAYDNASCGFF